MVTDEHITSYAIDPRFRGTKLDSEQLKIVHTFFKDNPGLNRAYRLFKSKLGDTSAVINVLFK